LLGGAALTAVVFFAANVTFAAPAATLNLSPGTGQPFALSLAIDKPVYGLAETPTIVVTAVKLCDLTVLEIDSAGVVWTLFPNAKTPNPSIAARKPVTVAVESQSAALSHGSAGVRQLIAVCTAAESLVDVPQLPSPGANQASPTLSVVRIRSDTAMAIAKFEVRP
jgi:hypothetical protein